MERYASLQQLKDIPSIALKKLQSSPYLERIKDSTDSNTRKSLLAKSNSDAKITGPEESIKNGKERGMGSKAALTDKIRSDYKLHSQHVSENKLSMGKKYTSQSKLSQMSLSKRIGSENVLARPNLLSNATSTNHLGKKHGSTPLLGNHHSDLPRTLSFQKNYQTADFKHHKLEIISMCEGVKDQLSKTSSHLMYNFLLSHTYKIINVEMVTETNWLRELSVGDKNDINSMVCCWEKVQEIYCDQMTMKEKVFEKVLKDFQNLEESNALLKSVIEQKPVHSATVSVVNSVQEVQNDDAIAAANKSWDMSDKEIQTDDVGDYGVVDVMDKAIGPDREIPVYRNVGVEADMRHPIQDQYESLLESYNVLEKDNETLKKDAETVISGMRRDFEDQLKGVSYDAATEINRLSVRITELQSLNDELEQKLLTATEDRSVLELELAGIKQQFAMTSSRLEMMSKKEEEEREKREKLDFEMETCRQEISQLTTIVLTERKEAEMVKQTLEKVTEENEEIKGKAEMLSTIINEAKEVAETAKRVEQETKELLEKEKEEKMELQDQRAQLQNTFQDTLQRAEKLDSQNSDLERVIAELMRFPDLSMGHDFKLTDPPMDKQFMDTLHHMIEHNNLRISLLEQRNNRFRDILVEQATVQGHEEYRSYRPLSASCMVFNVESIKRSRPQTAESTRTLTPETYIIGHPTKSRPISAASVRLLRPIKPDTPIDQLVEKPFIYSSVQQKQVTIQEGYSSNYPPSRFPFLNSSDPLQKYDGILLEKVERPTSVHKSKRPPSGKLFKWDV